MSAAPVLRLLGRARPVPSVTTLVVLHDLRVELERKRADGPYDEYDGELLEKWRQDLEAQILRVRVDLEVRLDYAPSLRDRFTKALQDELIVTLNAGDVGSPAFERFLSAMEAVQ